MHSGLRRGQLLYQFAGDPVIQHRLPLVDRLDRLHNLVRFGGPEHVAIGPGLQDGPDVGRIVEGGFFQSGAPSRSGP